MKIKSEIEFKNAEGEWDYILVDFEGYLTKKNDSFDYTGSHCTHGKSGTASLLDYYVLGDVLWDKSKYTAMENSLIEQYIDDKLEELENRFVCKMEEG